MAERRMFAKTVIDSDAFLDMPLSSQALYFHLSMRADDDGFINNPKKIQRMVGCADDDLKLLIAKNFIIPFESGIVVIKHWRIHNYIRNDRYKETVYQEEKALLNTKGNKAYTLSEPLGIPNDNQLDTQVRLGKDRIELGKDNNKKATAFADAINSYTDYEPLKSAINEFVKMRKTIKAPLTDNALKLMLNKLDKLAANDDYKVLILNQSIMNCWKGIYELKDDYKGGVNNGLQQNEYGSADADSKFKGWQPSGGVL